MVSVVLIFLFLSPYFFLLIISLLFSIPQLLPYPTAPDERDLVEGRARIKEASQLLYWRADGLGLLFLASLFPTFSAFSHSLSFPLSFSSLSFPLSLILFFFPSFFLFFFLPLFSYPALSKAVDLLFLSPLKSPFEET